MSLDLVTIQCPYCGENIDIEVEAVDGQSFVQDCSVCCHPISFEVTLGEEGPEVTAERSD